jgi:plasmid stabilization system protein ParE
MTKPLAVVFQRRAVAEIDVIDEWWRNNRPSAPDLFMIELERMTAAIALMPTLGARARNERLDGVRRVLLSRTRYHVYYRARGDTLEVLAVWHAVRGTGPGL